MANYDPKYFTMLAQSIKAREIEAQQQKQPQGQKAIIHTLLSSHEIELLIREFNPTKNRDVYASEWIREIELLGNIHKWDSCHLLLYSTMRLNGVAKTWYEYSMDTISCWEEFKEELVNNFPRAIDTADIHAKLIAKKRLPNQTIEEYFHTTMRMAKRIKLPDDAIKDYLIRGLQQSKHQIILSSIGPCSLTEFLQHMLRLEMDSSQNVPQVVGAKRNRSPDRAPVSAKKPHTLPPPQSPKAKKVQGCFACKEDTHKVANCPKRKGNAEKLSKVAEKKICIICSQTDHMARDCPKRQQNPSQKKEHPEDAVNRQSTQEESKVRDDLSEMDFEIDDEMNSQIDEVLDLAAK